MRTSSDPFGFTGALIDTQLRVGEPIGEGGFSVVYRGHHLGLDEPVAIKCLKLPAGLPPGMVDAIIDRFRAESRISYRLSQGNLDIVRSVSSGTAHSPMTGALVPYIALEWLEGQSLSSELEARRAAGFGGRPLGEVLSLLGPAATALDYAHQQGVVHRDVKPGNLLLVEARDGTRRIKVLDFGLAKVIGAEGTGLLPTPKTMAQVTICSPSYGAPEQFDGSLGPISTATDVYSFAMIVLELLRDEKLRPAASIAEAATRALHPKPRGPAALGLPVSPEIDAWFLGALALQPAKRPQTMGKFWSELQRLAVQPVSRASGIRSPNPLAHTAPAVTLPKPVLPRTTQPMKRPEAAGARDATGAGQGEGQAWMSTAIMSDRPKLPTPSDASPVKTAAMPAMPTGSNGTKAQTSSKGKVIVLVVLLMLLTSGGIILGGYFAHRWIAERRSAPAIP